jgi:ABC-type phosphate transport system ATPase subunit
MQKIKSGLRTSLTSFANMDTSFRHPFTSFVAGPTGCGKTTFVTRLLRFVSSIIDLPPERIVSCYGQWQKTYASMAETMPEVEFVDGLPDPNTFRP